MSHLAGKCAGRPAKGLVLLVRGCGKRAAKPLDPINAAVRRHARPRLHLGLGQLQQSCAVCGRQLPEHSSSKHSILVAGPCSLQCSGQPSLLWPGQQQQPTPRAVRRRARRSRAVRSQTKLTGARRLQFGSRRPQCGPLRAEVGPEAPGPLDSSSSGSDSDWPLQPSAYVPLGIEAEFDQPSEAGFVIPKDTLESLELQGSEAATVNEQFLYPPYERNQIKESWTALMRWSKVFRTRNKDSSPLHTTQKVVVFGGGSFGTAMGASLARQKSTLDVVLLLRDPYLCRDINTQHCNTKYLKDFTLPTNVRATTSAPEAIIGAQFAVHAVPVQHSRAFLHSIKDTLPSSVPIICVSKGLEVSTGLMMSEVVPSALGRKQPAAFISGPSFAREVMEDRPTGVVAAAKDRKLAQTIQALFASQSMRVNITTDVIGVEICGALKNVLAIAAGIVEGLELGNNALAALIAQGCSEIRWLAEKMGARPTTLSGLSGLGDIMLTCYGSLSRNRTVGIRLGRGETLQQILESSTQVAEGVATAGSVVSLARRYRVSLPVLTAVAQVLNNSLTPREAVWEIMNLPQVEEM